MVNAVLIFLGCLASYFSWPSFKEKMLEYATIEDIRTCRSKNGTLFLAFNVVACDKTVFIKNFKIQGHKIRVPDTSDSLGISQMHLWSSPDCTFVDSLPIESRLNPCEWKTVFAEIDCCPIDNFTIKLYSRSSCFPIKRTVTATMI